jgi:hypothetical protein
MKYVCVNKESSIIARAFKAYINLKKPLGTWGPLLIGTMNN